ncbi:MAG TPA: c-type cytochrome [Candidatus Saccharimonadales bacterium]|nr:c-type cytochrome [Candidatus Saccharimonadales bacterium]
MLKGIAVGILLTLLAVFGGAYLYFSGGHAPVATYDREMLFERRFARMALHSYLEKLPHPNPPVSQDEPNFLEGAKAYKEHCAVCHGLPGEPKNAIASGMYPPPPQLFKGVGVTDDEPWETYWKVYGGIRMTGMPGFSEKLSETKMWQVSVLLRNADKISPAVKAELANVAAAPVSAPTPANASPAAPGQPAAQPPAH